MRFLFLISIVFLVGCGNTQNLDNPTSSGSRQFETSDPVFDSYKNDYTTEANSLSVPADLSDIPINFGDLDNIPGLSLTHEDLHDHEHDENCHHEETDHGSYHFVSLNETNFATTVGVCIEYSNGTTEILIRESSWNTFSLRQREILIFHELGHCHLNRDHKDEEYKNFDLSLMNSLLIDQFDYQNYLDEYLEELFLSDDIPLRNAIDVDFP